MVVSWGCRFLRRVILLPVLLCCEAMVWSISFLAFPIRMLSAVERERKLSRLIAEMQEQMNGLVWENKDLEERLRAALKEQDAMDAVLDEMEEEQEEAFAKIDVLQNQLKALKQENVRLKEHKGKAKWEKAAAAEDHHVKDGKNDMSSDSGDKLNTSSSLSEADGTKARGKEATFNKSTDPSSRLQTVLTTTAVPAMTMPEDADVLAKAVARRRSLFSLGMSLMVGAVAWSADEPCLPLMAGLFAVVGVSMRSCTALRRGRGNGPAADAVVLLSLNWFLLGVLASPMLPGVARAVVPRASRALGPALTWVVATAPL